MIRYPRAVSFALLTLTLTVFALATPARAQDGTSVGEDVTPDGRVGTLEFTPKVQSNLSATINVSVTNTTVTYTSYRITNNSSQPTGALRLELWAYPQPYTGSSMTSGFRLHATDTFPPGSLCAGCIRTGSSTIAYTYTPPPAGTYYLAAFITEFDNASTNEGYEGRLFLALSSPRSYGVPPPPPPIVPINGVWWNPQESGTGYGLTYSNGVLVMQTYSFNQDGSPQYYLSAGQVTNNTVTMTLDTYRAGQCISCPYPGSPTLTGNHGNVTVTLLTTRSARMTLPGGRTITIVPFEF